MVVTKAISPSTISVSWTDVEVDFVTSASKADDRLQDSQIEAEAEAEAEAAGAPASCFAGLILRLFWAGSELTIQRRRLGQSGSRA
jgi:hypothetical protein